MGAQQPLVPESSLEISPEMIERGVSKFREWEGRYTDPTIGYPPLDCELREFIPELIRHVMAGNKP